MRFVDTLLLATALANGTSFKNDNKQLQVGFATYTAKWGKSYTNEAEYNLRFRNWKEADLFINNYSNPTMKVAHNRFSDWTQEEKDRMLAKKPS